MIFQRGHTDHFRVAFSNNALLVTFSSRSHSRHQYRGSFWCVVQMPFLYIVMILHISYKDYVTSEVARAKIQQVIGPHEDLLTIVKRRKLQWYGHVSCSSGLAKTILQGTVNRGRSPGRQRRWEENIRQWTGLAFGQSQRAVENREKRRKLVAKSFVVPQRPSRLRER